MKKIALIQSHCNTEEKLNVLKENIVKLRKLDLDILLFSHIVLPEEIIKSVDFFVYDKSNPILWDERRHLYWWANDHIKLESSVADYGWTVFNQIIKSYNTVSDLEYDMFYIVCYDLVIDSFVTDVISNNKIGKFKHVKPKNVNEVGDYVDVVFDTSLIFLSLTKSIIEKIVQNLKKEEYIDNPSWIAEKYLEIILERDQINIENLGTVTDLLHESTSVFNQSHNSDYEIFVDNQELLKFRYIKKNYEVNHLIIINQTTHIIDTDQFLFNEKIERLENFGVIINGKYNDFKEYLDLPKKINKISFLES